MTYSILENIGNLRTILIVTMTAIFQSGCVKTDITSRIYTLTQTNTLTSTVTGTLTSIYVLSDTIGGASVSIPYSNNNNTNTNSNTGSDSSLTTTTATGTASYTYTGTYTTTTGSSTITNTGIIVGEGISLTDSYTSFTTSTATSTSTSILTSISTSTSTSTNTGTHSDPGFNLSSVNIYVANCLTSAVGCGQTAGLYYPLSPICTGTSCNGRALQGAYMCDVTFSHCGFKLSVPGIQSAQFMINSTQQLVSADDGAASEVDFLDTVSASNAFNCNSTACLLNFDLVLYDGKNYTGNSIKLSNFLTLKKQ